MSGIRIYLQSAPWAMPITAVLAVVLLVGHVRSIRADPWRGVVGYLFWVSVAGFLAVTLAPNPRNSHVRAFSLTPDVPGLHQLLSPVDQSGLNAVIALPMGLLGALLAVTIRRWMPVLVAVLVPPFAEGVQWLVPALGRVGFYLGDVTANWTGVVLGLALGGLVAAALSATSGPAGRRAGRRSRRTSSGSG